MLDGDSTETVQNRFLGHGLVAIPIASKPVRNLEAAAPAKATVSVEKKTSNLPEKSALHSSSLNRRTPHINKGTTKMSCPRVGSGQTCGCAGKRHSISSNACLLPPTLQDLSSLGVKLVSMDYQEVGSVGFLQIPTLTFGKQPQIAIRPQYYGHVATPIVFIPIRAQIAALSSPLLHTFTGPSCSGYGRGNGAKECNGVQEKYKHYPGSKAVLESSSSTGVSSSSDERPASSISDDSGVTGVSSVASRSADTSHVNSANGRHRRRRTKGRALLPQQQIAFVPAATFPHDNDDYLSFMAPVCYCEQCSYSKLTSADPEINSDETYETTSFCYLSITKDPSSQATDPSEEDALQQPHGQSSTEESSSKTTPRIITISVPPNCRIIPEDQSVQIRTSISSTSDDAEVTATSSEDLGDLSTTLSDMELRASPASSVASTSDDSITGDSQDNPYRNTLLPRPWIRLNENVSSLDNIAKFTVLCYNILCDKYATPSSYNYCPRWALDWEYRKGKITEEINHYNADIVALQEVETHEYWNHFQPLMASLGYQSIFSAKSRAKTMTQEEKRFVDGCALFWKQDKFFLESEHLVEFTQLAIDHGSSSKEMINRVMTRDNIGIVAVLCTKEDVYACGDPGGAESVVGRPLVISTAHIHWDPEFCDVKLIQSMMLAQEIHSVIKRTAEKWNSFLCKTPVCTPQVEASPVAPLRRASEDSVTDLFAMDGDSCGIDSEEDVKKCELKEEGDVSSPSLISPKDIPVLICGDLNSIPGSGVLEFLEKGKISSYHADFKKFRNDPCLAGLSSSTKHRYYSHELSLESAYTPDVMPFTNYTFDFKGMIDYIFTSKHTLRPTGVLGSLSYQWFLKNRVFACPHPLVPSDHFPLLAEYALVPPNKQGVDPFKSLELIPDHSSNHMPKNYVNNYVTTPQVYPSFRHRYSKLATQNSFNPNIFTGDRRGSNPEGAFGPINNFAKGSFRRRPFFSPNNYNRRGKFRQRTNQRDKKYEFQEESFPPLPSFGRTHDLIQEEKQNNLSKSL